MICHAFVITDVLRATPFLGRLLPVVFDMSPFPFQFPNSVQGSLLASPPGLEPILISIHLISVLPPTRRAPESVGSTHRTVVELLVYLTVATC